MIWQEVRNDRLGGMGLHSYRWKRRAAVGRFDSFDP
jgi:hypothetical protein